jgi:hypothetical protein
MFFKHYHIKIYASMHKSTSIYAALLTCLLVAANTILLAQADIDVNIKKGGDGGTWYANPIVWVVGAAVFLLLLVALLRRK